MTKVVRAARERYRFGVTVSNGGFTVGLDFGAQFSGAARLLEIAVKPAGGEFIRRL